MTTLPQTNLQLYRLLKELGASDLVLAQVHAAYDVAKQLFGHCFRPDEKPFVCHLVGTASALAMWGQRVDMINAGLLYSAYLFGDFSDGERGASRERRAWLQKVTGKHTEDMIRQYTSARWRNEPVSVLHRRAKEDASFRDILIMKIADSFDEVADGGILYARNKEFPFGLLTDASEEECFLRAIKDLVGKDAAVQFRLALQQNQDFDVPACLVGERESFYRIRPGIDGLRRGRLNQKMVSLGRKIRSKLGKAA